MEEESRGGSGGILHERHKIMLSVEVSAVKYAQAPKPKKKVEFIMTNDVGVFTTLSFLLHADDLYPIYTGHKVLCTTQTHLRTHQSAGHSDYSTY